jgi:deazaflavin-dependent oxidoreductase (nitroreductase family)
MTAANGEQVTLPPRPLIRAVWALHRAAVRVTGGRFGLQEPARGVRFGMLRLHSVGRRSGQQRTTMVGYFEDGPNLVTLAMNGWGTTDPAWWLNLQANPSATIEVPDGRREVRARAATGTERDRLWATFADYPGWGANLEGLAARRPGDTAVVVFEPVEGTVR